MTRTIGRRSFLRGSAATVPWLAHAASARASTQDAEARELVRDPKGVIDLPAGFSYRILTRTGDPMSDGHRTPGNPDAMGVFAGAGGKLVIMRNHEIAVGDAASGPYTAGQPAAPE